MGDVGYDTQHLSPVDFFTKFIRNELKEDTFTTKNNFTYYSGPHNQRASYLNDFIATHDKIITPFSKSLNELYYSQNRGFGDRAFSDVCKSEEYLSQFRGHALDFRILEQIYYAAVVQSASRPEIYNVGPSWKSAKKQASRMDPAQRRSWYNNYHQEEFAKQLENASEEQYTLVIVDAKGQEAVAEVLKKHLLAA